MTVFLSYYLLQDQFEFGRRLVYLLFSCFFMASGAHVFNQIIEVQLDAKMPRTAKRPLPMRQISTDNARRLGYFLMILGIVFGLLVNLSTMLVLLGSGLIYLYIYTPLKTRSYLNTWVGAWAGSMPTLAGWTALNTEFTPLALVIPLIVYFWQIPHFLALAWKYREQYKAAGYKMIVCDDENGTTVGALMQVHTLAMILVSALPFFLNAVSVGYLVVSGFLGLFLLVLISDFQLSKSINSSTRIFIHCNSYLLGLFLAFIICR